MEAPVDPAPGLKRRRPWRVALVAALAGLLVLELVARFGLGPLLGPGLGQEPTRFERFREHLVDPDSSRYRPHAFVGYTIRPNGSSINDLGFRGPAWRAAREPGTLRIACLGGSTTEGEYPQLLGRKLAQRTGRTVEVLNFGVSGWTTAETLVNYVLTVQDFAPDLVVVHHAVNDVRPRLWPDFRSDYSHFRRPWSESDYSGLAGLLVRHSALAASLALAGDEEFTLAARVGVRLEDQERQLAEARLEPSTAAAFRRNLLTLGRLAAAADSTLVLTTMPSSPDERYYAGVVGEQVRPGLAEHNRLILELAAEQGWPVVDLDAHFRERAARLDATFVDHVHLTSVGKAAKAEALAARIAADLLGP